MSRRAIALRQFVGAALALLAFLFVVAKCTGCAMFQDKATQAEAAYLGEQLSCVDRAKTVDESQECRRKVRERWGIVETQTKVQR